MAHEQRHTRFFEPQYGWKNVVAGAIGGLVASFAMERFMALTRNLTGDQPRQLVEQGRNAGQIRRRQTRGQPEGPPVNAASLISERVF
ncbi:MAG TPA: hypothetical protein VD837_04875, partial [Terriglobales bacterium]|nr:hypothetical protein [Terriglobales bacterium]